MRFGCIGDLHGRDCWKEFVLRKDIDMWVFMGDYVDSFDVNNKQMIDNLLDVIQFKKDFPDKIILLLGNHCNQYLYLFDQRMRCSGFRTEISHDIHDIYKENKDLFVNAYQYKDTIFTHAGIQHNWFVNKFKGDELQVDYTIAEQLNNPLDKAQDEALYQVGAMRGGMRYDVGGPFWCDKNELKKPLEGFTQVVGHTHVNEIHKYTYHNADVWFCDCLRNNRNFLALEL